MRSAINELIRKYEVNPKDVANTYNLGVYYLDANQPRKAIELFDKIVNSESELIAEINFGLALAYAVIDKEKGEKYLDTALKIKPKLEDNFYMGTRKNY